jgi:methionine synthase II (cobalamin-independent)
MFQLNAGYFLIQASGEADPERVYQLIGKYARNEANGVRQMYFIGVINPTNPKLETPQQVCDALVMAAKYIPKSRLGSTDDCGFSPFSIDDKPNYGSPDVAREVAFQKIKARVQGTALASAALKIP